MARVLPHPPHPPYPPPAPQSGAALVSALLIVTLAVTVVSGLFWHQHVALRGIENQRLQSQAQWILRGALDWALLILREDGARSSWDSLDEPWATPLLETSLQQYVNAKPDQEANPSGAPLIETPAALSGVIHDAQGRWNIANLVRDQAIDASQVSLLSNLLQQLGLPSTLAAEIAQQVLDSVLLQQTYLAPPAPPAATTSSDHTIAQLPLHTVMDLPAIASLAPATRALLMQHLVLLPRPTAVNLNTASSEVLQALLIAAKHDVGRATMLTEQLMRERQRTPFKDIVDVASRLPAFEAGTVTWHSLPLVTHTAFFLIEGSVTVGRARQQRQTLVERANGRLTVLHHAPVDTVDISR